MKKTRARQSHTRKIEQASVDSRRDHSEFSSMQRQWMLLMSLTGRSDGLTLREMADEMQVTQKTIHRDLLLLGRLGFAVVESVGDFGRKSWRIEEKSAGIPLAFSLTEVFSLYVGRRFLEPLAGTNFWDGAHTAFKKIKLLLNRDALKYLDKWIGGFHNTLVGAGDYSRKADVIDALMIGIEDHRVTCLAYQSERSTEVATRDVHPLGLIYHRGSLYLVAFASEHQQVRHYKVDRIDSADVTALKFPKPQQFDLTTHLSGSFGIHHADGPPTHISIRFAPPVARYVTERRMHPSQKTAPQPDGSLRADFDLTDLTEIKSWLLSFGRHATVLEPESLRRSMREEIETMSNLYHEKTPQLTRPSPRGRRSK